MKPHAPRVSVIVVAHNAAHEIGAALVSLSAQTFQDFEVVVVDDGSTDGTVEQVQLHPDPRIRLACHAVQRGTAIAHQTGLALARGEFVSLLDADACASPQRLAAQVAALDADPSLRLVGSHLAVAGSGAVWRRPVQPDAAAAELLMRDCLSGVTLRRSVWPENELCPLPAAHAYWLNACVAAGGKVANIDRALTRVRPPAVRPSRLQQVLHESCVREVMREQIRRLGIEPSERELMLNRHVGAYTLPSSAQLLYELEAWLIRLFLANRESRCYPEPAFARMIGREWYEVCKFAAPIGAEALQIWSASPLLRHWQPSVPERMRFIAKCLLHHEREGNGSIALA